MLKRMPRYNQACGPYVITLQNFTPTIESYMARFVVKNGHQRHVL